MAFFSLHFVDEVLQRRSLIGMSDCRSLYDHLVTVGSASKLQPRWTPTDRMVADGLTKDKGESLDLLRLVFRSARYQLADEQLWCWIGRKKSA